MIRTLPGQIALLLTALLLGGALVLPYNGGYVLAYALMALTIVLVLALVLAHGRWEIGPAGWCFIAAFALIALAFTIDRDWKMAVNFIFLLAFVSLTSWLRRFAAPDSAAVVSWLALVGSLLSMVAALVQIFWFGEKRALGWWSDPIWSAEAALILGFLALMAVPVMRSRWRYLLLAGPVLGLGIVFLSGSRGPLLAAPVILVVLLLTTFRSWWKPLVAGFAVLVLAGALVLPFAPGQMKRIERIGTVVVQLFTTGSVDENSAGSRVAFWKASFEAFTHRPLTGYGWSKHVKAAYKYLPEGGKEYDRKGNPLHGNPHLHADILDMGVSGGSMGLLAYALILLAPLLGAIRTVRDGQYRARLTGAIVLSVGYAACGLSYLMFGYEFHTTLYVCLSAIVLGFCRDEAGPIRAG